MRLLEITIANRLGLHARAAARFVHLAASFNCRLTVVRDGSRVNGKSIIGLLNLGAGQGTSLRLEADGEDELQALEALGTLIRERFGEDA